MDLLFQFLHKTNKTQGQKLINRNLNITDSNNFNVQSLSPNIDIICHFHVEIIFFYDNCRNSHVLIG